jgi:hypothetical protein
MKNEEGIALLLDAMIWELEYEARHSLEFSALKAAKDGNTESLADLLSENGLATSEARAFAASVVQGKKKKGRPATSAQWEKELRAFGKIYEKMLTEGVGLEKGVDLCVEADPDLLEKEGTFRTHARRGEKKFTGLLNAYFQRQLHRTQN